MSLLLKLIFTFVITVFVAELGWAGTWQKGLKVGGFSNLYTQYDYWEWKLTVEGDFIKNTPFYSWAHQVRVKYAEKAKISAIEKTISYDELGIHETYTRPLSPYSFLTAYSGFTGPLTNISNSLGNVTFAEVGRNFTRYIRASTGLQVAKTLIQPKNADGSTPPDNPAEYSYRASMVYERSIGYRTKISWAPVVNIVIPTQGGASSYAKYTNSFNLNYILGKKISFSLNIITVYDNNPILANNSRLYRSEEMTLIYDIFQY